MASSTTLPLVFLALIFALPELSYAHSEVRFTTNYSAELPLHRRTNISSGEIHQFDFTYKNNLMWIRLDSKGSIDRPVFVVVHGGNQIISWAVPHVIPGQQITKTESRTLCLNGNRAQVDVFTQSKEPVEYHIHISEAFDHGMEVGETRQSNIRPLDRRIYFITVADNETGVVVNLQSNDSQCSIVSVDSQNCSDSSQSPDGNGRDNTAYAVMTMTRQATLTLFQGAYTVIVYIPPTAAACALTEFHKTEVIMRSPPVGIDARPRKHVEISIEAYNGKSYYAIVYYPLILLLLAGVIMVLCILPPMAAFMEYPAKPIYERPHLVKKKQPPNPDAIKGSFLVTLIVIAIMYVVPALQLLYTNQWLFINSGNHDQCYFNFKCIRPFYTVIAFNNVYSNLVYILFGMFFLIVVRYHSRRFTWRYREVFYALGVALMLEGVLSAGYHVCPAPQNFQFDTTFMYVTAGLCIYHLYHVRNPSVPGRPHAFYLIICCAVFYTVLGLLNSNTLFSIVLCVIYGITAIGIGAVVTQRLFLENAGYRKHVKVEYGMMTFHVIMNGLLVGYSGYSLIMDPKSFPSIMLYLFLANMFFFLFFYLIMKRLNHESVVAGSICCGIISLGTWAASLYFFKIKRVTEWSISPAESRELNQPCAFLDFFDYHDIWHMLSGFSIFVSLILLITLDATSNLGSGEAYVNAVDNVLVAVENQVLDEVEEENEDKSQSDKTSMKNSIYDEAIAESPKKNREEETIFTLPAQTKKSNYDDIPNIDESVRDEISIVRSLAAR